MSTNKPELFPLPRAGSQQWRTYWVQRREHGDTQAACPDTISEAEKLFEISDCGMSYAALDNEGDTVFPSCSYLELQKQQNRDWAKSIAQRVPESTKDSDCCEIMDKLSHALSLDPGCAMALGRRAQIYICTGQISRAKADIRKLEILVDKGEGDSGAEIDAEQLRRQLDEYICNKQSPGRRHDSSHSRHSEKHELSTSRAHKRHRESRSPHRRHDRRSKDRSSSRPHKHSRKERHRDHSGRRYNKTRQSGYYPV